MHCCYRYIIIIIIYNLCCFNVPSHLLPCILHRFSLSHHPVALNPSVLPSCVHHFHHSFIPISRTQILWVCKMHMFLIKINVHSIFVIKKLAYGTHRSIHEFLLGRQFLAFTSNSGKRARVREGGDIIHAEITTTRNVNLEVLV